MEARFKVKQYKKKPKKRNIIALEPWNTYSVNVDFWVTVSITNTSDNTIYFEGLGGIGG